MPGTTDAGPVLVMPRSAREVMGSLSVAIAGVRLACPAGGSAWAEFTRSPVAAGLTVPVAVKTTVAPTGTVTDVLMAPLPAAGQVPPPLPAQVHVTPVSAAGNGSVTVAPLASLGPSGLVTVIVYVVVSPATTPLTPLVFVMVRSVTAVATGVLVVALWGTAGGVALDTVAVLTMGLGVVYPDGTAKVAVIVRVAAGGSVSRSHGKAVAQSPAFETNVRPGGVGSASVTPVASDGPALVTVIV